MNDKPKGCYDPSEMSVGYRSTGSEPLHHKGVKFICFNDINGTYRRIELDDIRKAFTEPKPVYGQDSIDNLKQIMNDPWKHRSEGMRCRTCMFYVRKTSKEGTREVGRCRRHAPTMNGYPVVYVDDWCGDHKIDEMKV